MFSLITFSPKSTQCRITIQIQIQKNVLNRFLLNHTCVVVSSHSSIIGLFNYGLTPYTASGQ